MLRVKIDMPNENEESKWSGDEDSAHGYSVKLYDPIWEFDPDCLVRVLNHRDRNMIV